MIKEISYNLPGYGFASCYLLGQAIDLMDMLEDAGILEKMKNTCQLGTMKYIYPGAHHTRYEYVFTQLMLISNVVSSENPQYTVDFARTSNLSEYEELKCQISGGAVMQCLAILSNIGHMYDTFTSAKMVMKLLIESRDHKTSFYKVYRRNLPRNVWKKLDYVLDSGNFYKLHLFHALHILQSLNHSTKRKELCKICVHLVTQLIEPTLIQNEATNRIFYLYKKIRKIAYMSVDMVYTPASFGANLNRMIYSISSYVNDLFDNSSAMNKSIEHLEDIIHKQIYNSPFCILNTARIVQEKYNEYKKVTEEIEDVYEIRKLLLEYEDKYNKLHSRTQPKAIKGLSSIGTLLLSKERPIDQNNEQIEDQLLSKLSMSRIAFGLQPTQNLATTYAAYGLLSIKSIQKDVQTIISHAISFDLYRETEKWELIRFAVQSIYKYGEYFFNFTSVSGIPINDCIFIGNGCKKIACEIRSKFTEHNVSNKDQLHEILSCASVLENIHYSGLVLCFVGGIKANKYKKSEKIDELDGLIYLPNRQSEMPFAYIVEAKNYTRGETNAIKQLEGTKKHLSSNLDFSITPLIKCAYMQITLNSTPILDHPKV